MLSIHSKSEFISSMNTDESCNLQDVADLLSKCMPNDLLLIEHQSDTEVVLLGRINYITWEYLSVDEEDRIKLRGPREILEMLNPRLAS